MKDGDTPKAGKVTHKVWLGMMSNADPSDLPPGATVEQTNATCIQAGQLTAREGFKEVTFD